MSATLLLENLPAGTTDVEVRDEFARYGATVDVQMVGENGAARIGAIVKTNVDPITLHVMVDQARLPLFPGHHVRMHVPFQHS